MSCLDERNEDVWYCSENHLLLHRKKDTHGEEFCYPFKVMQNDKVGRYNLDSTYYYKLFWVFDKLIVFNYFLFLRYIVATRDIHAGEVIYEELPLAVGPNAVSTPQCILCHNKVIFVKTNQVDTIRD